MISNKHIRLLRKISKGKVVRTRKQNPDLNYLYNQGYIGITSVDKPDDYFAQPYLTEKGKARLYQEREKFVISKVPIIISIIALIKSFDGEIVTLCRLLLKLLGQ